MEQNERFLQAAGDRLVRADRKPPPEYSPDPYSNAARDSMSTIVNVHGRQVLDSKDEK